MSTRRWPPLSVAVLALPAVIGAFRLVMAARQPFDFYGDEAILESAVRHVGEQLLGPYSRFGFHQPGPAYFYVQALFYRMPGASAAALFAGAYCINLGAALGCVLVVRRFLGEAAARWAVVVVGAFLLCLTPRLLADPWNPYVLALPVLLAMVLAAAGTRSPAAAGGAIVVGSYVVQTHVAAAATLAAVFASAAAVGALHHLRTRQSPPEPPSRRSASVRRMAAPAAVAVVLALMWAPPLIEQATRSPGNFTKLIRFFRAEHPEFDRGIDHAVDHTAGQVAAQLTVLPFGHDREAKPVHKVKVLLALLAMTAGAGVAVLGWRRRETVIAALGAMSAVGPLVAIWSGTRIVGEIFPYLLLWTSSLLLPGAIGAGALLTHRQPRRALVGIAAGFVGFSLVLTMARHPLRPYSAVAAVGNAARLAEPWLARHGIAHVRISIASHDRWPLATGLAVRLEKDGFTSTVDQNWTSLFGEHFGPTGHEQGVVWIADAEGAPPPSAASPTPLGVVGDASVWANTSAMPTR